MAKCVPDPLNNNLAFCFCDVKKGINYSVNNDSCNKISPFDGVNGEKYIYSTFSPLISKMGYERINCPSNGVNLNCMNKICSINPNDPTKAICICSKINNENNDWVTFTPFYISNADFNGKKNKKV
jgi:hypothetical protein